MCNLLRLCTIISCDITYLYLDTFLYIQFIKCKYRSLTIGSLVFIEQWVSYLISDLRNALVRMVLIGTCCARTPNIVENDTTLVVSHIENAKTNYLLHFICCIV